MPLDWKKFIRHLFLPAIAPVALIRLYFTPKSVFGCANRGYMAIGIVFLATVAAVASTVVGVSAKKRGEIEAANWWTVTTLILLIPIVLLIGLG